MLQRVYKEREAVMLATSLIYTLKCTQKGPRGRKASTGSRALKDIHFKSGPLGQRS